MKQNEIKIQGTSVLDKDTFRMAVEKGIQRCNGTLEEYAFTSPFNLTVSIRLPLSNLKSLYHYFNNNIRLYPEWKEIENKLYENGESDSEEVLLSFNTEFIKPAITAPMDEIY